MTMRQGHIEGLKCESCGKKHLLGLTWENNLELLKWAFERVGIPAAKIEYSDGLELEVSLDNVELWTRDGSGEQVITIQFDEKGEYQKVGPNV